MRCRERRRDIGQGAREDETAGTSRDLAEATKGKTEGGRSPFMGPAGQGLRAAVGVTNFAGMRLLRALTHLVLALALLGFSLAPGRTAGFVPPDAHQHADRHGKAVAAEHTTQHHSTPAGEHPAHKPDACQTACCFIPAQLPARALEVATIAFCEVRYERAAAAASGRADAPEPGIPKHLT